MNVILDLSTTVERASRIEEGGAHPYERVARVDFGHSFSVLVVVVSAGCHSLRLASVLNEPGIWLDGRVYSIRLSVSVSIAEGVDSILRHLRSDGDMRALGDVSLVLVARVAFERVEASGMERERATVVCVGDSATVLVDPSVSIAPVDRLREVFLAGIRADLVRSGALAVARIHGGESGFLDGATIIVLLEDLAVLSGAEVVDGVQSRISQRVLEEDSLWIGAGARLLGVRFRVDHEVVGSTALLSAGTAVDDVGVVLTYDLMLVFILR